MRSSLGTVGILVIAGALLCSTGCSSGSSSPPVNSSVTSSVSSAVTAAGGQPSAQDPADAAFVAQLRNEGLLPSNSVFPDAAYVTDAQAVCNLLALPGESAAIKATDMVNTRNARVRTYGITAVEANRVMILSAQTYCPAHVTTVQAALG